jgi:hypothetical protein
MTGLSGFEPGLELECAACEFRLDARPGCLIALELADDCEPMTAACCPTRVEAAA